MTEHPPTAAPSDTLLAIPPNAPDLVRAAVVTSDDWARVHAVVDLVNSWRRPRAELYPPTVPVDPVTDLRGTAFEVQGPAFVGRAEREGHGLPAHLTKPVRLTTRGAQTRDSLMTATAARGLAAALNAAADEVERAERR